MASGGNAETNCVNWGVVRIVQYRSSAKNKTLAIRSVRGGGRCTVVKRSFEKEAELENVGDGNHGMCDGATQVMGKVRSENCQCI